MGIGTYKERNLHAVMKIHLEPDSSKHEIRYKGFIADIVNDNGITEIQTQGFDKMRRKLEIFLETDNVTLVYPAVHLKWLSWIDPLTGEITKRRKSTKTGTPYSIYPELYKIKYLLSNPKLKIHIYMVDLDEYRRLDGWNDSRKSGSSRFERIPLNIEDAITIDSTKDYIKLIPQSLTAEFNSEDFKKESQLSMSASQTALNVLNSVKAVERIGKKGNSYIYRKC